MQEKRTLIIIIRQYINNFDEKLKCIYGKNKELFIKKLITLSIDQLKIIRENIKFELNLKRNHSIFFNTLEVTTTAIENISTNIFNIDIKGGYKELSKDPEFQLDLLMISSEIDISKYINPKSTVFIKLMKQYYMLYNMNKVKKQINNNIKEEDIDKLKNKYDNL